MKNQLIVGLMTLGLMSPVSGFANEPVASPQGAAPTVGAQVETKGETPSVKHLEKKIARRKRKLEKLEKKLEQKKQEETPQR